MAKVFISYSHDSDEHRARVRALADKLDGKELQVVVDQYVGPGGPDEGWPEWSEAQVRQADSVLIMCTETYCRRWERRETPGAGHGAIWETRAIYQELYYSEGINKKFRAVLFEESDRVHIPNALKGYKAFRLYRPEGQSELEAWLTRLSQIRASSPNLAWPSPAAYVWEMADRKETTARLERMLTGQLSERILLLGAESNSGKTLLLAQLKAYAQLLGVDHSLLDCKGSVTLDELLQLLYYDLRDVWRPSQHSGHVSSIGVIQDLQRVGRPVLLMFDTYEQASEDARKWIENQLLSRLPAGVVIVIAGQVVPDHARQPWASLAEHVQLKPIQEAEDWLEYSQRKYRNVRLSLQHIEALTLATEGKAGHLAALLETMVGRMQAKVGAQGLV
jgi:hypothetical protein